MTVRRATEADPAPMVDPPNHGACAFYDRLGFEEASRMLRTPVDRLLAD